MAVYSVSYDLHRPGQNYTGLIDELKKSRNWWHYLESTWLIVTNETASQLWDRLSQHVDANDSVLVIVVRNDKGGWLPKDAWDWINANVPF